MIETIRDANGNITAVCEWLLFDKDGKLADLGETIFIGEFEINPEHRGNGVVRKMIKTLYYMNPQAKTCFFWRERKYPGRGARIYTRDKWAKLIGG